MGFAFIKRHMFDLMSSLTPQRRFIRGKRRKEFKLPSKQWIYAVILIMSANQDVSKIIHFKSSEYVAHFVMLIFCNYL